MYYRCVIVALRYKEIANIYCNLPNIVCFPSSHCVGASVMKNCDPFVSGPEFAIDNIPAPISILTFNSNIYTFIIPPTTIFNYSLIQNKLNYLCVSNHRVSRHQNIHHIWTSHLFLFR